jgi:hypothetical protein
MHILRNIIIVFSVFFIVNLLKAQQLTFENSYKFLTNEEAAKSCIEDSAGGFVIGIGPKFSTNQFIRDYGLIKLNNLGDTVWYTTFFISYNAVLHLVKCTPDKGYITIGLADDSVSGLAQSMLWISKFDSLGYLLWSRFYSNSQFRFLPQLISAEYVIGNNLFICTGYSQFIILDSAYNFVNSKTIPHFFHGGNFPAKELSIKFNDNFWYYTFYQPLFTGPYSIKLLEVDQNCDSVKTIAIPNDTLGGGRIVKITSSYFIIIGYKTTATSQSEFFISKIDTVGNKLWSKNISASIGDGFNYNQNGYCTLKNLDIVAAFTPSSSLDKRGILYCFNDNGDSLWTQYYKNDTLYETALLDLVATSDSGLLACGQIKEPNGVLKDYIFKTNKEWCNS